ncbi:hypothetical protein VKT23_010285 [Stygiomarasmius scandens]|uniref:Uncharacterized protein n=1 Tax=Marasmiellus scandens TaxID=2682957 RepID=A0ABR1JEL6_9AGAR
MPPRYFQRARVATSIPNPNPNVTLLRTGSLGNATTSIRTNPDSNLNLHLLDRPPVSSASGTLSTTNNTHTLEPTEGGWTDYIAYTSNTPRGPYGIGTAADFARHWNDDSERFRECLPENRTSRNEKSGKYESDEGTLAVKMRWGRRVPAPGVDREMLTDAEAQYDTQNRFDMDMDMWVDFDRAEPTECRSSPAPSVWNDGDVGGGFGVEDEDALMNQILRASPEVVQEDTGIDDGDDVFGDTFYHSPAQTRTDIDDNEDVANLELGYSQEAEETNPNLDDIADTNDFLPDNDSANKREHKTHTHTRPIIGEAGKRMIKFHLTGDVNGGLNQFQQSDVDDQFDGIEVSVETVFEPIAPQAPSPVSPAWSNPSLEYMSTPGDLSPIHPELEPEHLESGGMQQHDENTDTGITANANNGDNSWTAGWADVGTTENDVWGGDTGLTASWGDPVFPSQNTENHAPHPAVGVGPAMDTAANVDQEDWPGWDEFQTEVRDDDGHDISDHDSLFSGSDIFSPSESVSDWPGWDEQYQLCGAGADDESHRPPEEVEGQVEVDAEAGSGLDKDDRNENVDGDGDGNEIRDTPHAQGETEAGNDNHSVRDQDVSMPVHADVGHGHDASPASGLDVSVSVVTSPGVDASQSPMQAQTPVDMDMDVHENENDGTEVTSTETDVHTIGGTIPAALTPQVQVEAEQDDDVATSIPMDFEQRKQVFKKAIELSIEAIVTKHDTHELLRTFVPSATTGAAAERITCWTNPVLDSFGLSLRLCPRIQNSFDAAYERAQMFQRLEKRYREVVHELEELEVPRSVSGGLDLVKVKDGLWSWLEEVESWVETLREVKNQGRSTKNETTSTSWTTEDMEVWTRMNERIWEIDGKLRVVCEKNRVQVVGYDVRKRISEQEERIEKLREKRVVRRQVLHKASTILVKLSGTDESAAPKPHGNSRLCKKGAKTKNRASQGTDRDDCFDKQHGVSLCKADIFARFRASDEKTREKLFGYTS